MVVHVRVGTGNIRQNEKFDSRGANVALLEKNTKLGLLLVQSKRGNMHVKPADILYTVKGSKREPKVRDSSENHASKGFPSTTELESAQKTHTQEKLARKKQEQLKQNNLCFFLIGFSFQPTRQNDGFSLPELPVSFRDRPPCEASPGNGGPFFSSPSCVPAAVPSRGGRVPTTPKRTPAHKQANNGEKVNHEKSRF